MNILEIKNLSASYEGHEAIKDINIDVKKGDYICLVGENGSGKSTLIKTIVGLHKKDSGEIIKNIDNDKISYLAQNNMKDLDCHRKRDNNDWCTKTQKTSILHQKRLAII